MVTTIVNAAKAMDASGERQSPALTDGFHLVVDALKLNGIDTIYGVAGIPITDLARLAQAEGIRYIGFRHEQSAGNAAAIAGYLTQKPGICMTVSAPGFLNGLVATANATLALYYGGLTLSVSGATTLSAGDIAIAGNAALGPPHSALVRIPSFFDSDNGRRT